MRKKRLIDEKKMADKKAADGRTTPTGDPKATTVADPNAKVAPRAGQSPH